MNHSSTTPSTQAVRSSEPRLYELDWLRTAAIVLVVAYHVGMFFVSWDFHLKSSNIVKSIEPLMRWMHAWRMPLLLFISGIGTAFMLKKGRSVWKIIGDRHNRLMIPLVFGMFVIVPPQIYIEKAQDYASYLDFYPSVLEFVSYPEGSFSWHHLWFICYLFFYSIIALPFFLFYQSSPLKKLREGFGKIATIPGMLCFGVVPLLLSDWLLRESYPHNTHALVGDWACFSTYFIYFIAGYFAIKTPGIWAAIKRDRWIYLGLGIIAEIAFELCDYGIIPSHYLGDFNYTHGALANVMGWLTLIAIVGFAQQHLRIRNERLIRWNAASYPVYVLHQTILLLLAAPLANNTSIPWLLQAIYLFMTSLLLSYIVYKYIVRPVPLLRLLFGLKWTTQGIATQKNQKYASVQKTAEMA